MVNEVSFFAKVSPSKRICRKCKTEVTKSNWVRCVDKVNSTLNSLICKQCTFNGKEYYKKNKEKNNAASKNWYQNNKETVSASNRKRKYDISSAEYDNMLEEQDNKCKICLTSFADITIKDGRTPVYIDHCHTTNKIRGLLCNCCNSGLGFFKDNTETLTNAIVYLEHTLE